MIENVSNSIGVKISDCNGNPIPVSEIEILNNQGSAIQKIAVNKFGFGKFQLLADGKTYKTVFTANEQKIETIIPAPTAIGVSLEINSYVFKDKTIAKIKTNQKGIEAYKGKPLYFVIQQDNKSAILDVNFDNNNLEQTLIFSNNNLFEGVNTIRVIDSELKQIAERYIFKYPENNLSLNLEAPKKTNETIKFTGKFNLPNTSASISVLPEQSVSSNPQHDIIGSILINPFCFGKQIDVSYYFTETSKLKQYELDLLLLNQKGGKYNWNNLMGEAPKIVYDFDMGLTLKGTLNQTLTDKKKYRVQLYSIASQLNEFSEIDDKNEFYFKNLVIADSTWVNFTLVGKDGKTSTLKVYPQVLNGNRTFTKSFKINNISCSVPTPKTEKFEMPILNPKAITLDDVEIEIDKNKLKYKKQLGNSNLRGYKITDDDPSINLDLMGYLRNNGFDVERIRGEMQIFSRTSTLSNGRSSPAIFVANMQQSDYSGLENMKMRDIDEIYINTHSTVPTSRSTVGIIKIYPRTGFAASNKKSSSVGFQIKNAFSSIETFKAIDYESTTNKGFQNFGTINWTPNITTLENGEFKFEIPNMNQSKVKILVEGFSADGKLISETRTIQIQ